MQFVHSVVTGSIQLVHVSSLMRAKRFRVCATKAMSSKHHKTELIAKLCNSICII